MKYTATNLRSIMFEMRGNTGHNIWIGLCDRFYNLIVRSPIQWAAGSGLLTAGRFASRTGTVPGAGSRPRVGSTNSATGTI